MGGAVSAGADNDELIDNLLEADYIKSTAVERVFRAVDRAHYFTVEYKDRAYRDLAWKCGNLHISAPCIYSEVMENLKLGPGMSFLNLGSGTGYLSTMAGLILGSYGINHGIEIHEDVLDYASKRLDEFISTSSAIDEYEFCQPKFVFGNCLYLGSGLREYDRVYCGAACPENYENYMKNLIKVGGILVMPINDQLLQICRTSDTNWESKAVLPVSFATLISGKMPDSSEPLSMPDAEPLSLQDICRFVVRSILRKNIDLEHPELKKQRKVPRKRCKKKTLRQLVIPIFNNSSDGEEEQHFDNLEDDDLPEMRQRGFVMGFTDMEACRSLYELSQILQEPPNDCMVEMLETNTQESSTSGSQTTDDSSMEETPNFEIDATNSSENIFEGRSDERFLSEFEELYNLMARAETSTSGATSRSYSETESKEEKVETRNIGKQNYKNKNKAKREKIDSGIVDDMESKKESSSDSDHDDQDCVTKKCHCEKSEDQNQCLKVTDPNTDAENTEALKQKSSADNVADSQVQPPPVNMINYTTCMKEKIKMLPLPMTLKYFLNLNREL